MLKSRGITDGGESEEDTEDTFDEEEELVHSPKKKSTKFLNSLNNNASSMSNSGSPKKVAQKLAGQPISKASEFIKTQTMRKVSGAIAKVQQQQSGPKTGKTSVNASGPRSKITHSSQQSSKVTVKRPNINGATTDKTNVMGRMKITTAGGPTTQHAAPAIIIKVRTLKPEEVEMRRKKQEEEDKKIGERKIIIVDTKANEQRAAAAKKRILANNDSMEDSEDGSDMEDEDSDIDDPLEMEDTNREIKNKRLLSICKDAIESLKERQAEFTEPSGNLNSKDLDKKTLDKFVRLSTEITKSIQTTIETEGETLSDSDNFEEYCQDVLDSIALRGDEEDMTQQDAEKILVWLHRKEDKSVKKKNAALRRDDERTSNEMMLYTQILELLTAASNDSSMGGGKLNNTTSSTMQDDMDEAEEEEAEDEMDEEEMDDMEEEFMEDEEDEDMDDSAR